MIAARRVARLAFLLAAFGLALESAAVGAGSRPPVAAENGMVVSSQRLASEVGVAVLRDGGNAIDAAVAVGYALAVVDPCCGNIGGGGFATIRLADGTTTFFNFRETAPAKARPDMFLDDKGEPVKDLSVLGYLAVGVPGTVLGLEAMRETYGTLSREALLAPAIRLAREGFVLSEGDAANFAGSAEALAREPNVAAIFFRDGAPLKAGARLVQTDLATTLETISDGGPGAFYAGPIAAKIVAASNANGGILSRRDFADFTVRETAPLTCRGLTFVAEDKTLIDRVDLAVRATGATVVMGYNGAGKSLLLRLLHGMLTPTGGEVLWNGRPVTTEDRKRQAMVFQKPALLRRTALDNVRFVLASRGVGDRARASEILSEIGLDHIAGRAARRLSGGEQQRLALGMALATRPDILFLDEATASLDPSSVHAIEAIVGAAQEAGTKIVMVTHDIGQARRLAAEVVFVDRGRIAEQASAAQFFTNPVSEAARFYLDGKLPPSPRSAQ